jgi:Zn-dependent M28 family amino/carboxypeptidase
MKKLLTIFCLYLFSYAAANGQEKLNVLQLLTDIKTLSSDAFQGRKTGTTGSKKAQEYIIQRFLDYKLMFFGDGYEQPFSFEASNKAKINGTNLIGYMEGTENKNTYLVVFAHYDHLGIKNNEIYNGADDNASGVAGLFALAEHFTKHKPKNSIIFVAFDAEEIGLKGANHFVNNLPVPKDKVVMGINMDMISRSEKNELYACGTYHYPFLKQFIEPNKNKYDIKVVYGHDLPEEQNAGIQDWTLSSDHGEFHKAQIPFIYFGVEDHDAYHKPNDKFEFINQVFFVKATELIIAQISYFDDNLASIQIEAQKFLKNKKAK